MPGVASPRMRIFVAGASGVIGVRIVTLLVDLGHEVAGMTRSPGKSALVSELGAQPVVCDVFDLAALTGALQAFRPEAVVHQLTALPDDVSRISESAAANNRIRREGTSNLIAASSAARFVQVRGPERGVEHPGRRRSGDGGPREVGARHRRRRRALRPALRYWHLLRGGRARSTRIQVDEAARRTVPLLEAPSGVVVIAEDDSN